MKLKVINIDGKEVKDIEISDEIFSLKPNVNLIWRTLFVGILFNIPIFCSKT